jgi:L-lactate utilization protein LutB
MEASKEFNAYKRTIYKALRDKFLKTALERAVKAFRQNRDAALAAFPDVVEKREPTPISPPMRSGRTISSRE